MRRPAQENLKDLLLGSLEVRQEPDLLERLRIEILRFVEDQYRALAGSEALHQEVLKRHQSLSVRLSRLVDLELLEHVLENAAEGEHGVRHVGYRGVRTFQLPLQGLEQSGLARSDFGGEQDESLALLDGVGELGQGLPVAVGQVQEVRVRRGTERVALQAVETEVDGHDLVRLAWAARGGS